MSIATLILGKSGTGKSTSMRNLDPANTALIQVIRKPLPFRSTNWKRYNKETEPQGNVFVTENWASIIKIMRGTKRKVIVIDDFQYLMANEFMRRSEEKGFDKFSDIAKHAWEVFGVASDLPDDVRVYVLSHIDENEATGAMKMKTIGKLLDEKINLEGLVTICLRTHVDNSGNTAEEKYRFITQNTGLDTSKSPEGMFDSDSIPNDLKAVDSAICDYYGIETPASAE